MPKDEMNVVVSSWSLVQFTCLCLFRELGGPSPVQVNLPVISRKVSSNGESILVVSRIAGSVRFRELPVGRVPYDADEAEGFDMERRFRNITVAAPAI